MDNRILHSVMNSTSQSELTPVNPRDLSWFMGKMKR